MALFDKLFSLKRKLDDRESRNRDRSCQINPEQVRLLLFKESDWRDRKILFDSSAIEKVPARKNDKPNFRPTNETVSIVEVSEGFTYMYKGPMEDAKVLGEMTFGAVAMNYKNVALKIHIMDEPSRLMCTKVFCVPPRQTSRANTSRSEKLEGNRDSGDLTAKSQPLSVPILNEEGASLSFSMDRADSGFYGDHSPYSSVNSAHGYFSMFDICNNNSQDDLYSLHFPPGRKLSTSSNGSWQRRTFQNMATRFDFGQSRTNLLEVPTVTSAAGSHDSQIYSNSSTSGTSDSIASGGSAMVHRKVKLGLALVITVADSSQIDVVRQCLEHSPQLQALVFRLRLATLRAGANNGFVSTLYRATEHAARWLSDLVYGPRLQPVWLNLVMGEARASNRLAESLLSDLCSVLAVGDTKNTNFFISTLLTYVLTYHLGWVSTVSPYDTVDHQTSQNCSPNVRRPYNAMWAQLSDLCGSIGFPPRAARTIVCGSSNTKFLKRLLVVLTYFMRCGDVKRKEFQFQESVVQEIKEVSIAPNIARECAGLKRNATHVVNLGQCDSECLKVSSNNAQNSDNSASTLTVIEVGMKKSPTLASLGLKLSKSCEFSAESGSCISDAPVTSQLKRTNTVMMSLKASTDSSLCSSLSENELASEQKVVFVLGDSDKLVGLKNKSVGGKSVKKSSKIHNEPLNLDLSEKTTDPCKKEGCEPDKRTSSPSKCCGQTLQHSKPIKHSGFKFEFDKYPQIVTNYMKSKNLEILDRHYIGKPGNLKLDNFQFDPTVVLPIQEEKCDTCVKCQMMENMLQTPTNASEMEYMNDIPRLSEPQFAKETIVEDNRQQREMTPKSFVRQRKKNTVVVNVVATKKEKEEEIKQDSVVKTKTPDRSRSCREKEKDRLLEVKRVVEFPVPRLSPKIQGTQTWSGYDGSLLGGVTDHYVPDLVLQGTVANPKTWECELRGDLNLTSYVNKALEAPVQAIAIVGDVNTWDVRVLGRGCGSGGMSSLVGAMLDTLPTMWKAKVPAQQCILFLESKLREFCVLSKTLADMLMSTDFCDIATLTKSLNIDINDVPLLLAVATTHTPQVASRYGLSYD